MAVIPPTYQRESLRGKWQISPGGQGGGGALWHNRVRLVHHCSDWALIHQSDCTVGVDVFGANPEFHWSPNHQVSWLPFVTLLLSTGHLVRMCYGVEIHSGTWRFINLPLSSLISLLILNVYFTIAVRTFLRLLKDSFITITRWNSADCCVNNNFVD